MSKYLVAFFYFLKLFLFHLRFHVFFFFLLCVIKNQIDICIFGRAVFWLLKHTQHSPYEFYVVYLLVNSMHSCMHTWSPVILIVMIFKCFGIKLRWYFIKQSYHIERKRKKEANKWKWTWRGWEGSGGIGFGFVCSFWFLFI